MIEILNNNSHNNQGGKMFKKLTSVLCAGLLFIGTLPMEGCINQQALAALVTTLGNSAAAVATIEGNTALAQKLKVDVAAASAAVLNWKSGTPAQMVIEGLNLVEDDLNLFPVSSKYVALIDLAIATTESIIQIVTANTKTTVAMVPRPVNRRTVVVGNPPKNADQFKKQWNSIISGNPALLPAYLN